jgi:demethoxyubiquinone hydroxylase (CLK1/Coq7/Cat5 family)
MDSVKNSLHFMHCMERFATEVYRTQRGAFRKSEIADEFRAAMENEHEHAVSLRNRVIEVRGVPARMGFLFQLTGVVLGILTRIFGKRCILRADILVEKRAIKDYDSFVSRIDFDEQTIGLLRRIIQDEEKHVENWRNALTSFKD